jgi:hypothetical protein
VPSSRCHKVHQIRPLVYETYSVFPFWFCFLEFVLLCRIYNWISLVYDWHKLHLYMRVDSRDRWVLKLVLLIDYQELDRCLYLVSSDIIHRPSSSNKTQRFRDWLCLCPQVI